MTNNEFIDSILKDKLRKIVVTTNTPYDLSIPKEAENVIVTLATSPDNIEVVAGVLFGEVIPEGECQLVIADKENLKVANNGMDI